MKVEHVRQAYASIAELYIELFGTSQQVHADDLAFIAHARAAHTGGNYQLGSFEHLAADDHSIAGILAWGSLIHLPPQELGGVLAEFRRAMTPGGTLVVAIFVGDEVAAFDHKVITAYRWPVDAFSERLARAGFTEVERLERPSEGAHRPHAAIAAIAAEQ